jgi:hypothetical protein
MNKKNLLLFVCQLALGWSAGFALGEPPTLTFSQIADGGGINFELSLTNSGHLVDAGTIFFRAGNGSPLSLVIGGESTSSLPYSVQPGGVFKVESDGEGDATSGYAIVESSLKESVISGTITYSFAGREVSVPSSSLSRQYHTFVERSASANSGIAFANPSDKTVVISVTLVESDGSIFDKRDFTLPPGNQLPKFLEYFFEDVGPEFQGSLHAVSEDAFAMVGLRQQKSGSLAILSGSTKAFSGPGAPAHPAVAPPEAPRTVLVFPQIADGGGITSEIILTNSGGTEDNGIILIKAPSGAPLPLSIGDTTRSTVPYKLEPGGAVKIQTDGKGSTAKSGYVLVETSGGQAQISGSIIYSFVGFEVSVPNSSPADESHLLVEKTDSANSGVAIANLTAEKQSVEVFVLNDTGGLVDEAEIELEGGQQKSQFITQIFDELGETVLGSFHARSDGAFAILGLRQKKTGSLSTLSGAAGTAVRSGTDIGPAGGVATSPDGKLSLTVPAGAVSAETTFEILPTRLVPDSLASSSPLNRGWKLKPDGLRLGSPADLTWTFDDALDAVPSPQRLGMLQWNNQGTISSVRPSATDTFQNELSTTLNQLGSLSVTHNPSEGWSAFRFSWEQNSNLNWYLEPGGLDSDKVSTALTQWAEAGSNLQFTQVGSSSEAQLIFRDVGDSANLGRSVECQAGLRLYEELYGVACFEALPDASGAPRTMTQNDRVMVELAVDSISQTDNSGDLQLAVLLHETGHALGLAHPWRNNGATPPVMAPDSSSTSLQPSDQSALQCHYGPSSETIELTFSAKVASPDDIDDESGLLGISAGETFTGTMIYEVPATDHDPDPTVGSYFSLTSLVLEIGPNTIEITPPTSGDGPLEIGNELWIGDSPDPSDYFQALLSLED